MNRLVLIDGRNSIIRHQSVHNGLSREDGFPTGALFGCLGSMLSISKRLPDVGIIWVWDGMGDTWRHTFMRTLPQLTSPEFKQSTRKKKTGYKGNRTYTSSKKKSKFPEDVRSRALLQIPVLKLILEGSGIRNFEIDSLECDDMLAMLVKRFLEVDKHNEVIIHSGDKDYYQLLADRVRILTRIKEGKPVWVTEKDVRHIYHVKPKNWAKFEALTGGHNNVPHLQNIGKVRARQLLKAGLDPSNKLAPTPVDGFERYFEPYGVEKLWPCIHGNYKLCKLVTDPQDSLLSEQVRKELAVVFDKLTSSKRFFRRNSCKTPDAFRKVSFLLAQYELASIIGRRDVLWKIP